MSVGCPKVIALMGNRATGKTVALRQLPGIFIASGSTPDAMVIALESLKDQSPPMQMVKIDEATAQDMRVLAIALAHFPDVIAVVVPQGDLAWIAYHGMFSVPVPAANHLEAQERARAEMPAKEILVAPEAKAPTDRMITGFAAMLVQPISADEVGILNGQLNDAIGIDGSWDFRLGLNQEGTLLYGLVGEAFDGRLAVQVNSIVDGARFVEAAAATTVHIQGYDFNVVAPSVQPLSAIDEQSLYVMTLGDFYKMSRGVDV